MDNQKPIYHFKKDKTLHLLGLILTFVGAAIIVLRLLDVHILVTCECDSIIYLSIFCGGIVLLIGSDILRRFYKDHINSLIQSPELRDYIATFVEENNEQIIGERERNVSDEAEHSEYLNTVIVPVAKTLNEIKNDNVYKCPKDRTFKKGLEYIAFYKDKRIVGYGKLLDSEPIIEDNFLLFRIESFNDLNVEHTGKYAFVQNKRYCNSTVLIRAKTTTEI